MDGLIPFIRGFLLPKDGNRLEIFYNPKEIEESISVNYAKKNPIGHSHPVFHYCYGEGNDFTFTLLLKSKVFFGVGFRVIDLEEYIKKIEDLCRPVKKNNEMVTGPAIVTFVLGSFVRDFLITKVQVKRKMWDRWMKLKYAFLDISCSEVVSTSRTRNNYIGG